MTTRAEHFDLYARARRDLTIRQRLGFAPCWPDRPAWLRPDFDELDVAVLRKSLRETWPEGATSEGVWEGVDPAATDAWDHVAADDDIDAILKWVDARVEEDVAALATEMVRRVITGGVQT